MSDVEWILTDHLRKRIAHRFGAPLDLASFRAEPVGIEGLRLWTDRLGRGLLVREDIGTDWVRCTVVTAYDADMVDYRRQHATRPFVSMPLDPAVPTSAQVVPVPDEAGLELEGRGQDIKPNAFDDAVLSQLAEATVALDCLTLAAALDASLDAVSTAMNRLAGRGLITRVGRKKKTWTATEAGRAAAGVPGPALDLHPPKTEAPYQIVLRDLAGRTDPATCPTIARDTGLNLAQVASAISKLALNQWAVRVSKAKRLWMCTEAGRAAAEETDT